MSKFDNDDAEVRIKRYINVEYEEAVEKYSSANQAISTWTRNNDTLIYKICSECSEKLYSAVEHILREYILKIGMPIEELINLAGLCEKLKNRPELDGIELSVFVTKKEPRNESTHNGRLTELGDYYRVIYNLRKLILILSPTSQISDVSVYGDKFDFNKFFYDIEEFNAENCHYILFADPMNDIQKKAMVKFINLPWSIIIDFDGKSMDGSLYKSISNLNDVQTSMLQNIKNQGISETTFKLKKTVYLSMENNVVPRKVSKWKGPEKENFEYFVEKSRTVEKQRAIVVVAKAQSNITDIFLEKIIDIYSNENVSVHFLEGIFDKNDEDELRDRYEKCYTYNVASIFQSIEEIVEHKIVEDKIQYTNKTDIIKLPSYDGEIIIDDVSLINNIKLYFEILDLSIGKDSLKVSSEEAFLRGEIVSWEALNLGYDILPVDREIYDNFIKSICYPLGKVENRERVFSVLHKPGFGGTTLSRRIAWDIHNQFPVLILQTYDIAETSSLLTTLYETVKRGILIVADENYISKVDIDRLQNEINNSIYPIALLIVRRIRYNIAENKSKTLYLNNLVEVSINQLEQKCRSLALKKFPADEVKRRDSQLKRIASKDKCPLLISLYYLEELFEGTEEYVRRFINELSSDFEDKRVKKAICIVAMCDFFGQKKVFPAILEKILNPTDIKKVSIKDRMRKIQDLFVFDNSNGSIGVRSKHFIISKEIIKIAFPEDGKSLNWKDYIKSQSFNLIDILISICGNKIDMDIQMFIKDLFIENRETEYLKGKFSLLIENCENEEDKGEILEYLTNQFDKFINDNILVEKEKYSEHQLLAHFWGHLGRFYSKKGKMNNPHKAEECCRQALQYSEQTGHFDYIIFHIAGDSTAKRMQFIYEGIETTEDFKEHVEVLRKGISQAEEFFKKSVLYGNEEYGKVGIATMWVKFLEKFLALFEIQSTFNLKDIDNVARKLNDTQFSEWIMDGITQVVEIFEYTEFENYSETAQNIMLTIKSGFFTKFCSYNNSDIMMELNNYLTRLKGMSIQDGGKISNVKRLIVRTLLNKYEDNENRSHTKLLVKDANTQKDLAVIMEYINDNIIRGQRLDADYSLWFKLMRYTEYTIDDALVRAMGWYEYQKENTCIEPWAVYYLYVLNFIRALEGYSEALSESKKYQLLCRKICEEKRKDNFLINYSRTRDWLGNGKLLKKLIDDRTVKYADVKQDDNIMVLKGRFLEIDPSNRRVFGYLSVTEPVYLSGAQVFFKPGDCGVTSQQIGHIFEFKMGFSYERLIAFDKSVKDITIVASEDKTKIKSVINQKQVRECDLVHFRALKYQKEKKRLKGIICENGKTAFLSQGEIDYNRFIRDNEMEEYVEAGEFEVKVIRYDSEHEYYNVSIKQISLGVNSDSEEGTMFSLFKNIKL